MKIDLLSMAGNGGCSSKIPAKQLEEILQFLPVTDDPDILVGIETHDDAGVYRINDGLALVLTTDFFPPVCSDPYDFGQISAANSISDIYAMGADPVLAMNIMMFPSSKLPMEAYSAILKGGYDKAAEAGVRIIGGHTIDDFPPKYGLAVTGFVHPGRIMTNANAREGDILILTKPLGTGIISAGARTGLASEADLTAAVENMKTLNKNAAAIMKKHGLRAATDITGFGLAGHALKMARASGVTISLEMGKVPLLGGTYGLTDDGCIPGASFRNLEYAEEFTSFSDALDYNLKMIAFDAQTSGGLLMCVPHDIAEKVLDDLQSSDVNASAIIGSVLKQSDKLVKISN
ncbi:MAG TPA: selenide, water dikinase SelD [Bacteroidales bacterium]|jgi:selenide,water dikinase|nr:selenide, water dikinase SelD [Bacteroidales bacterium]